MYQCKNFNFLYTSPIPITDTIDSLSIVGIFTLDISETKF